ncbi:MAG TPA: hypothetical protein VM490_24980 [Armatimonadaceae bacterium]|nr:hypothetical protein [Armatimonadaceae bacterium]
MAAEHNEASAVTTDGDVLALFRNYRNGARVFGFLGAAGLILGLVVGLVQGNSPFAAVLQSYVYGYIFWLSVSLGSLGLLLLHNVVRAKWSSAILRVLEAGAKTLPYMAALFLPFLIAVWGGNALGFHLFHWADPAVVAGDPVLQHKSKYLNPTFWTIRAVLFFALWIAYANFLTKSGRRQDETKDERLAQNRVDWAAPGGVLFVVTLTFAFTDWLMSLDPHWLSTIYGAWWMICSFLAALSLGIVILTSLRHKRPYSLIVTPALTRDLGNVLLGFVMMWGYFSLSQFLIYWSGNLPEYNTYYLKRFQGPLVVLGGIIVVAQFFIPFLALIAGRTKRTPELLRSVAIWILVVRVLDVFWQVTGFFDRGFSSAYLGAYLLDLAAFAFVGGVWLSVFLGELRKYPLLPAHDTRLIELAKEAHH